MSNIAIFGYTSCLTLPTEGFPWDDLHKIFSWMSADDKGTKRRENVAENFNRLSRVHERYRVQTDDRQTGTGRTVLQTVVQFSAHVCCGQMAGWIKMPLGMEVGLGPGHTVLDGAQLPLPKGVRNSIQFSVHVCRGRTAGWIKMPLGAEVGLGPGDIVLDGDARPPKGHSSLPTFRSMSIVGKRLDRSRCHMVRR